MTSLTAGSSAAVGACGEGTPPAPSSPDRAARGREDPSITEGAGRTGTPHDTIETQVIPNADPTTPLRFKETMYTLRPHAGEAEYPLVGEEYTHRLVLRPVLNETDDDTIEEYERVRPDILRILEETDAGLTWFLMLRWYSAQFFCFAVIHRSVAPN